MAAEPRPLGKDRVSFLPASGPILINPSINPLGLCVFLLKDTLFGTSLVAQWLRIRLPKQGTRVRALVREDPTCRGATSPCATTTEPTRLEPVLRNKRSHRNEKPAHRNEE